MKQNLKLKKKKKNLCILTWIWTSAGNLNDDLQSCGVIGLFQSS